ncbi:alpha/beta hydrolase [Microbulbifer sp. JMSA003]|uniref:alpha/beta hydrolase n=1 Tax=Microbulbifer sp. JMSA003 TaxID=3243369 RepID=UPI0040390247
MLIITNRNIRWKEFKNGVGSYRAFGNKLNRKGANEIRIANADMEGGEWRIRLVKEPKKITKSNLPSEKIFNSLRSELIRDKLDCVFFIHGFDKPFVDTLRQARRVEWMYGVKVILFSWPSNPGGIIFEEYPDASKIALASAGALASALGKVNHYMKKSLRSDSAGKCNIRFSLFTYSLGSRLLYSYMGGSSDSEKEEMFDNVILCQSDVDRLCHEDWIDRISIGKRVYITINEYDKILKVSEIWNGRERLGRASGHLYSEDALYFDFTGGPNVGRKHGLFYKKTNKVIRNIFHEFMHGRRGESVSGMTYNPRTNSYKF